jgi:uncharacterized protein (TIGR00730 family)
MKSLPLGRSAGPSLFAPDRQEKTRPYLDAEITRHINRLMTRIQSVCVYCGSSPGHGALYLESARILGRSIAEAGLELVYGGGARGLMGAVSDAAIRAGGRVTGIIPRFLLDKEASVPALGRLHEVIVTDNMHQRKHRMFEKSDAFVALPGGIGTLEEVVEIMTWAQLGHHRKPIVFANVSGFWDPMLSLLEHMKAAGFIHTSRLVRPIVIDQSDAIVATIVAAGVSEAAAEGVERIIEKM